jgi:HNH endonuclease
MLYNSVNIQTGKGAFAAPPFPRQSNLIERSEVMSVRYNATPASHKFCPVCGEIKQASDFNKSAYTRDGLQSRCRLCERASRIYVETTCLECGQAKRRRSYQLNVWDGRCRSCAQKLATAEPQRKARAATLARQQVLRQGGIPNAAHFTSDGVRGEGNPRWKGGITPANQRERSGSNYATWRTEVFIRDGFTCQLCGQVGGTLHAHHKQAWSDNKSLRYDINNGATLCADCHQHKAHRGSWKNPPVEWPVLTEEASQA